MTLLQYKSTIVPIPIAEAYRDWQSVVLRSLIRDRKRRWTGKPQVNDFYFFVYTLEGRLLIFKNGKRIVIDPGHALLIPPGVSFQQKNNVDTRLLIVRFQAASPMGQDPWMLLGEAKPVKLGNQPYLEASAERINVIDVNRHEGGSAHILQRGIVDHFLGEYLVRGCENRKFSGLYHQDQPKWVLPFMTWLERVAYDEDLDVSRMAEKAGYSRNYFAALFSQYVGKPPHQWLRDRRIQQAARLLIAEPGLSIGEIGERCGMPDIYQFSKIFKTQMKASPRQWRSDQIKRQREEFEKEEME